MGLCLEYKNGLPIREVHSVTIKSCPFEIERRPAVKQLANACLLPLLERHDDDKANHPCPA
jgi:hypothetical protein